MKIEKKHTSSLFPRYKDYPKDKDGWIDAKEHKPPSYGLVHITNGKKTFIGWWTGAEWYGKKVEEFKEILYWKRSKRNTEYR